MIHSDHPRMPWHLPVGAWLLIGFGAAAAATPFAFGVYRELQELRRELGLAPSPKATQATIDALRIAEAVEAYATARGGRFPDDLETLVDLDGSAVPRDPWGNEYRYDAPAPRTPRFRVYTLGRDGVPGGGGDDADIDNWTARKSRR